MAGAVERLLATHGATRWLTYDVGVVEEASFRQEKRGRPGQDTRWRHRLRTRFALTWTLQEAQIAADARADGLFPLLTNDRTLTAGQLLTAYKSKQPLVEKRHDLLNTVKAATPVYLKSISRIEALCVLHFIALLVHALIEREVRAAMATGAIPELPLYPEDRAGKAPSAARILEMFSPLQRHHLLDKAGRLIQRFDPDLTPLQRKLLPCLAVSPSASSPSDLHGRWGRKSDLSCAESGFSGSMSVQSALDVSGFHSLKLPACTIATGAR